MTDPHTAASWHYRNAKRHKHKTGIGMTIRERASNAGLFLIVGFIVGLAVVALIMG